RPGAVEAPFDADAVEILGACAGFGEEAHRVASQPDDGKDRQAENEERDEGIERAPDDELRHHRCSAGAIPERTDLRWIGVFLPSRCPLRGLLRMTSFLNAIINLRHPEEAGSAVLKDESRRCS